MVGVPPSRLKAVGQASGKITGWLEPHRTVYREESPSFPPGKV